ncbi:MAG: hypothetical protein AAF267_10640 [Deinococcota bacterium]
MLTPQVLGQLIGMFLVMLAVVAWLVSEGKVELQLSPKALRWFGASTVAVGFLWLVPSDAWSWNFIELVLYLAEPTPDVFRILVVSLIGFVLYAGIFMLSWGMAALLRRRH